MRSLTLLGATGSIGASTLDLIRRNREEWHIVALTAGSNAVELAALAREFSAEIAVVADASKLEVLQEALAGSGIYAAAGEDAIVEAAMRPVDMTIAAIVGCAGLRPTMAAIERGGVIGLANKEALVSAGEVMTAAVARHGATLLPVDSEHNAIFQCLAGNATADVRSITLTASGGPFREWSHERLRQATPSEAVRHPNWSMGAKISVDSATMFNKGLELIEAYYLFGLPLDQFRILVHPQSIIHSMVEYRDGSTLAQLGPSDMRVPIASVLAWPQRMNTPCAPLDLAKIGQLSFEAPNEVLFPATRLAREAAQAGGACPGVLNAANEVAVDAFLRGQLGFLQIAEHVEAVLEMYAPHAPISLADVLAVDAQARIYAQELMEKV